MSLLSQMQSRNYFEDEMYRNELRRKLVWFSFFTVKFVGIIFTIALKIQSHET